MLFPFACVSSKFLMLQSKKFLPPPPLPVHSLAANQQLKRHSLSAHQQTFALARPNSHTCDAERSWRHFFTRHSVVPGANGLQVCVHSPRHDLPLPAAAHEAGRPVPHKAARKERPGAFLLPHRPPDRGLREISQVRCGPFDPDWDA